MSAGSENRDADGRGTTCTACRGSGKLLSSLGGTAHEVTCPWCAGSGEFHPGKDAQEGPPADPDRR